MPKMQNFIESCLFGAAKEISTAKAKGLRIKAKARNDMATSADFASESFIVNRIRKSYPDSVVLSEESYLKTDLKADSLFVVDPIDGTHNFIQEIPLWGISIAHFSQGKPTAGGIYLVPQNELFYAEKGKQSTLNKKKISVSRKARLEDFFLLCDTRINNINDFGYLNGILALEKISQHTRFLGVAVHDMGYVACGKADAVIHFKLKPYDFAAAAFIVEQAGGTVTSLEGKEWGLESTKFLCSNGKQHKRIIEVLKKKV